MIGHIVQQDDPLFQQPLPNPTLPGVNFDAAITGTVSPGHGVASKPSTAYPEGGTVELQAPFFEKLGLDLREMKLGTLNVQIGHFFHFGS